MRMLMYGFIGDIFLALLKEAGVDDKSLFHHQSKFGALFYPFSGSSRGTLYAKAEMASLELAVCQQPSQSYGYTNK